MDTGPNINQPVAGSNAIGSFVIGISPIGDIAPFDFNQTIISQYANSPIMTALIATWFSYFDQTQNIDNFIDQMLDISSAVGYGLDVWGLKVGVSRTLNIPGTQKFFGFEEATTISADPFNQSAFFAGEPITSNFQLSDDSFRTLILAKALANISDGSIKSINQILINLFPNRGNAFVVDNNNMTMVYKFNFVLTPVELAIVSQSGVLPKSVGVSATVAEVS
jgi:Protein of unknown function (DUF2612)